MSFVDQWQDDFANGVKDKICITTTGLHEQLPSIGGVGGG
jgi:hypothetical protein